MPASVRRWLAPLLCLIVLFFCLAWVHWVSVPGFASLESVEIAPAAPDGTLVADGDWTVQPLPWGSCDQDCERRHFLIRHRFELSAPAEQDWGVYIPLYTANVHVYLDGQVLDRSGRVQLPPDAYAYHPRLAHIPAQALTAGPHTLLIQLVSDLPPRGGLGEVWLGPAAALEQSHLARSWLTQYAVVGVAWALACSLVLAGLLRRQRREPLQTWFLVCAPFWLLQAVLQVAPEWLPADYIRWALVFAAQFGCMAFTPLFLLSLFTTPSPQLVRTLLIGGIAAIAAAFLLLVPTAWKLQLLPDSVVLFLRLLLICARILSLLLLPWMLWLVLRIARARPQSRSAPWLVLCAALPALGALADLLRGMLLPPIQVPLLPLGGIGVALALWLEWGRRVREFERQLAGHAEELAATVQARELELEASFARLREADRERALAAERQRLLRDMHDGVGGQLASLVHLADNPATERGRVVEGLREGLADLRLILDSLASEDDLLLALGRLRHRLTPTLQSAGIALKWRIDQRLEVPPWPPEAVLHLYRIVQEATHNAIRHAQARELSIALTAHGSGLCLEIADDGVGLPDSDSGQGYGLTGLRDRAARLGATLEIHSSRGSGTCIRLLLPALSPGAALDSDSGIVR